MLKLIIQQSDNILFIDYQLKNILITAQKKDNEPVFLDLSEDEWIQINEFINTKKNTIKGKIASRKNDPS